MCLPCESGWAIAPVILVMGSFFAYSSSAHFNLFYSFIPFEIRFNSAC